MSGSATSDALLLGRFRVLERVGSGSFGRVFRVLDPRTSEPRALKLSATADAMLLEEFAQLSRLQHPSLPRVFEVGRIDMPVDDVPAGAPYFLAEWIPGGRSDTHRWDDPRRVWSLLADVAGALSVIHEAGLVHGDVAPANILVVEEARPEGSRAVLVDLGLSSGTGARGTPAFMAPEALAGHVEARSDLYGLGATVVRLVTGRPLFEAADLGELVRRITTATVPPTLPELPRALAALVGRLVAADVDHRPASAHALLDELDQLLPMIAPGQARRARPSVRPPPAAAGWPGARAVVDALTRALGAPPRVHVVVGGVEAGASELVDAALRRWQLEDVARGLRPAPPLRGGLDALAGMLGVPDGPDDPGGHRWIDVLALSIATSPTPVVCELNDDPRAPRLIAALARTGVARPVLACCDDATVDDEVIVHVAPLLDVDAVRVVAAAMLGSPPPRAWAEGLHGASGGQPLTTIELLRSIAAEPDPIRIDWSERTSAGSAALRARQLATLGDGARGLALVLALHGGAARIDRALSVARGHARRELGLAEVIEVERAGIARRRGDVLCLERAAVEAILAATDEGDIARAVAAALATSEPALPLEAEAALLLRAPMGIHAARACEVAAALLARGRGDRARALATRATSEPAMTARATLLAARAAAAAGAYADVRELVARAVAAGADRVACDLVVARASQRAGALDDAERTLSRIHADRPDDPEVAGAYARLLVTRSRFPDARQVASAGGALSGLRAEAAGLAAFYLGELDDADRAFAALELGAAASGDAQTTGRALALRGMVAQQRGQLGLASDRYREAIRQLEASGEVHARAVAELNLGTVLAERGRASDGLPMLVAARRVFAALGATTELVAADLNRGNALLVLGQVDEAHAAAAEAVRHADGAPHLRAFASLVLGDALRRRGEASAAERAYREALAIGAERGDAHAQVSAHVALAEAGHPPEVDVEALCAGQDDRDRWTVACGRLALREHARREPSTAYATAGAVDGAEELIRHARRCSEVATRATDADRLDRAYRAAAVAAALARRGRDETLARSLAGRARAAHAALVAATAPAFRAAVEADPDATLVPDEAAPPAARPHEDVALLRRLLALSRRLNTTAEVERILDEVIDTAIELTAAERGFLLLRQADGQLVPVVSRNFVLDDLDGRDRSVSRSIAERATQTGEPVVTVDAGLDERFSVAASVAALRLRSVMVVPLRQRGAITGCIYVDHRLREGAFGETAASLLGELADIAAIAIENARLTDDLRRTTRVVDELNQRLAAELADREAELVRARADRPDRDRLRHRYEQIVGRSPAMVRMLDVLDRAAATSLPVVVVGESGTGKELVARALHDHGARRDAAFVAINCSAVPDQLLESELFGHVRGAFTGAERDRSGLFEIADKGTLFLDEIADTSPGMQAKLLRVLQDGLIRRVGDTRTRKVDVRIVAASQRPLVDLVAAGTFRDDLRYRLEVINLLVPPLRERDGDIPLLVERLLARLTSGRTPPRVTRAAMRALGQHRWPGNVRELENALARGLAMGDDVIDAGALPEAIAATVARPEPARPGSADELRLRPALHATEQAYISAAMARARGNQTVAARLLGLSRFGLQKKLRRLAGDEAGGDAADDDG